MRRVSSSNVLVVPPFEVTWISDEMSALKGSSGCISFEARGENDATVMLRTQPGSTKRIQQLEHSTRETDSNDLYEPHYTVIFGSNMNRCLKIERNSQECFRWDNAATVCQNRFTPCWISFEGGRFKMGAGTPGKGPAYTWEDPVPLENVTHVGFGSWNSYVCFKNIKIQPLNRAPRLNDGEEEENAYSLEASVASLQQLCKQTLLTNVKPTNICSSLRLVELLSPELDDIATQLVTYFAQHHQAVRNCKSEAFYQLSAETIAETLGHPHMACREIEGLKTVLAWVNGCNSPDTGESDTTVPRELLALLKLVRFPLITSNELQECIGGQLSQDYPEVAASIAETAKCSLQGAQINKGHSDLTFARRFAPASRHLMFISSGDRNGVLHWLGTSYGTQNWINPVLSQMVQLHASSPSFKHTDSKAVASSAFQRLNFAGSGKSGTWWKLDLGQQHRLIVNYYTIRHDGSVDFVRDWSLQGSIDGDQWMDLKVHENDISLSRSGQMASWPVNSHAASFPYQMFRLLLQGPNASIAGNRETLHLSTWELYGHFFKL